MSSAISNLLNAIVEGKQSMTQLLMTAKVIAARLELADVLSWVDSELNGYPKSLPLPSYRTATSAYLQCHNPYRGWQFAGNLEVPIPMRQPIADIENLAKGQNGYMVPPEPLPVLDSFGNPSEQPQHVVIPGSEFAAILQGVKNRLLQWTLDLEKRGIKGEDMNFDKHEKQSAASQVFNIQNVNGIVGNAHHSQVTLYDYGSIHQLLIDRQVSKQDRREFEDIIDELKVAPAEKKSSILERAKQWILKHKELLGAGAELVGKAAGVAFKQSS